MRSERITHGIDRAPARAMLRAVGFRDEDFDKPIVAIANTWTDAMPCNYHLRELAQHLREGIREAGGVPVEFNTIAVNDAISMGTEAMKASLISREVIADSIELMAYGYQFDALVAIVSCDKTIPGGAMGVIRAGVPAMVLYGGSIAPGHWRDRELTIVEVFEAGRGLRGRKDHAGGTAGDRATRDPGTGSLWWAIYGEHDGDGTRSDGLVADGLQRDTSDRAGKGFSDPRGWPSLHGGRPGEPNAARFLDQDLAA
jgi:hypothetical protein